MIASYSSAMPCHGLTSYTYHQPTTTGWDNKKTPWTHRRATVYVPAPTQPASTYYLLVGRRRWLYHMLPPRKNAKKLFKSRRYHLFVLLNHSEIEERFCSENQSIKTGLYSVGCELKITKFEIFISHSQISSVYDEMYPGQFFFLQYLRHICVRNVSEALANLEKETTFLWKTPYVNMIKIYR